ncbi:MAG: hypothetical protein B6I38_08870 [Anaerolineaceae bacterium 4572_5.1]|nr:MAG: hypothetical protein B6I38_08870 [Anaerolineaceae bacterium 4572_5.1]RLD04698.1 MAG: hypothetical protein DRI56_10765 [Chloroflexota bacterium]
MSKIIDTINGTALYLLSVIGYRTCRFQISGIENLEAALAREKPLLMTSWHGMTMMLSPFIQKHFDMSNFVGLVPADWRGKTLEVFAHRLGAEPFSMNLDGDSTLTMGRELIKLIRKVKNGKNMLLHPDGPAGPAYVIKPGVTFIAQKAGATLVPMGAYCRHAYRVPRWDLYTLPLPFSRIALHIGKPIVIPPEKKNLDTLNHQLTDILNRMAAQAAANYYELKP